MFYPKLKKKKTIGKNLSEHGYVTNTTWPWVLYFLIKMVLFIASSSVIMPPFPNESLNKQLSFSTLPTLFLTCFSCFTNKTWLNPITCVQANSHGNKIYIVLFWTWQIDFSWWRRSEDCESSHARLDKISICSTSIALCNCKLNH